LVRAATLWSISPRFADGRPVVEAKHYLCERPAVAARVVATDPVRDLSVLRLESVPEGVQALPLAGRSCGPGDEVHSVGNSGVRGGLGDGSLWWYTRGSVRQVHRRRVKVEEGTRLVWLVETQAPVNEGDSGGPVVDSSGKLVGVTTSYSGDQRLVSQNVDVREVRAFLAEARGKVARSDKGESGPSPAGTWKFRARGDDGKSLSGEGEFRGDGTFVLSRPGRPLKGRYAYANGQLWLILQEGLAQGSPAWRGKDCFCLRLGGADMTFDRHPPAVVEEDEDSDLE